MAKEQKNNKELLQYAGLATQWLVMIGLAVWLGMWLDKQISDTSRILTVMLPLLAIIISLIQIIRNVNKPKN
ncbi:MAG: AtpZ/AtpI family protein [Chitinophagaceae bacterium]|nr:AtpZ/AtpI family protein [Chitinophagaceae bacterium]